jgi:hypothetical protein
MRLPARTNFTLIDENAEQGAVDGGFESTSAKMLGDFPPEPRVTLDGVGG